MTLVDPTAGLGYSFGQKLPSTHMTTIAANQPKAVDGDGGGTWTPSAPIIINGASALQLGGKLKYTTRSVARVLPLMPQVLSTANWNWQASAGLLYWQNLVAGTGCQFELPRLAHNSVLTSLRVIYKGAAGHGALPGTMPSFRPYRVDSSGTYTAIAAATSDSSATTVAYEVAHSVSVGIGGSFTVDLATHRYILAVSAESGMGALTGAQLLGIEIGMDITEQAEV